MQEVLDMTQHEIMTELEMIIEDAKTAVLATVDKTGCPHMRWMTPTILKDRKNAIFAITSAVFDKTTQLKENCHGEWLFQTRILDTIISVRGKINLLDNSSIKNEVLEAIGPRLTTFWRLKADEESSLIVIETVIEEAVFFKPMKGLKQKVKFL